MHKIRNSLDLFINTSYSPPQAHETGTLNMFETPSCGGSLLRSGEPGVLGPGLHLQGSAGGVNLLTHPPPYPRHATHILKELFIYI